MESCANLWPEESSSYLFLNYAELLNQIAQKYRGLEMKDAIFQNNLCVHKNKYVFRL